ncbi:MAG: UTP--glucose-1-phosphate uridylyltransferase [Bdellovibrionota bacterium]|jgi:UTP--glucose-1-phosphate uridylyltransferase
MQEKENLEVAALRKLLEQDGISTISVNNAVKNYARFLAGETGYVPASEIKSVDDVVHYEELINYAGFGEKALSKVAIINLNGGLGTSMGLSSAKSLLNIKDGFSFLDITVAQVEYMRKKYEIDLPLLFMNSFSTDADTKAELKDFENKGDLPVSFLQSKVRKIDLKTLRPVSHEEDRSLEWCPPGHGDVYAAMYQNGILDLLLEHGFEYIFISNVDNLGATLDLNILGYLAKTAAPFIMEVADRTEADKKGGHLARRKRDNRLILRELAQCPENEQQEGGDFQNIRKYKYFNTNSLWLNIRSLKDLMDKTGGVMELPLIVNRKTVDPRDETTTAVVQLETAMGAAISSFDEAVAVRVPRTRFAPVKSTDDLIVLRSDRYRLTPEKEIVLDVGCVGSAGISIKLDKCFNKIDDFEARFSEGVPSMIACESLLIEGDFSFGSGVKLIGNVKLCNKTGAQVQIPAGAELKGKISF